MRRFNHYRQQLGFASKQLFKVVLFLLGVCFDIL